MDPTVVAAWIAAGVSALTLAGTLAAQYYGYRATSRDAEKTAEEQRKQLDRTLAEQRTRTFNERFATAAGQLGSDKRSEVRLAGVYAMAGLADDWPESRQTCVDVLCACLRMPYRPDPGPDAPDPQRLAFQANREVRHTVIRVITAHLRKNKDDPTSWQGLDLDFTGVVFDGGDFSGAMFSGGLVSFTRARFPGGKIDFSQAEFSSGKIDFSDAEFSGGAVHFDEARFPGGEVYFLAAKFSGGVVSFGRAEFSGGTVRFAVSKFSGGVIFIGAKFSGGRVDFDVARFSRGDVRFLGAEFSGGVVSFDNAEFSGSTVQFSYAKFSGGTVNFGKARFSGGEVDFSNPLDWSSPPTFPWTDTPPAGVKLPER
jgi:uncharacterized protein YjbI with pentapeptide repeats